MFESDPVLCHLFAPANSVKQRVSNKSPPMAIILHYVLRAFLAALLLAFPVLSFSWPAKDPFPLPGFQLADTSGQSFYAGAHPYLNEPLDKLIQLIPELKSLQPSTPPQSLHDLLSRTATNVNEFVSVAIDLVAHESIRQEILRRNGSVKSSQRVAYNYLILHHRDGLLLTLDEYRADLNGDRVDYIGTDKGFSSTSGFALLCLNFESGHLSDSDFRYLGEQDIGPHKTFVVAFAQRPGFTSSANTASGPWGSITILLQGIAWIDQDTFQILRLRTDLLAPRTDIGLDTQTTVATFSPIKLPDFAAPFWLPVEVTVFTAYRGQSFRNVHSYSDYKRYRVSVNMVTPP